MKIPKNESLVLRRTRLRAARLSLRAIKNCLSKPDLPQQILDELLENKKKTVEAIHRLEEMVAQQQQTPNKDNTYGKPGQRRNQHS